LIKDHPMTVSALRLSAGLLAFGLAAALPARASVDIPYQEFRLDNGLRVIVHEDRKAPIVAVNVWYHVGSKDEAPGKTGFAHLFEHLMFQGSENYRGEFFEPFEQVGATGQNGTTNFDRTNYFQNVPTTALDMALWMESDRMGHFLGAIDQSLLDEQRGVVQNEKRQSENEPYGRVWETLFKSIYPVGHPYSWMPIGSMEDLEAASLDDVKQWFRGWYGPNNAVLVLAGDIDLDTAKEKVSRYFAHIPASPPAGRLDSWVAPRSESTRETLLDRVPQPRVYKAWNVAQYNQPDVEHLQLLARVLGGSRSSRLDRRLVHELQLADSVSTQIWPLQLSGVFIVTATVKTGVDPAEVEAVLEQELARLLEDGPSAQELEQARTVLRAGFIRGIERVGGFGGKSDALAECAVYTGDPGCFRAQLARIEAAQPAEVRAAGQRWLRRGDHTLTVLPYGNYSAVPSEVDRSTGVPQVNEFPEVSFPALQRAQLANGIEVVLAERHEVPVVQLSMEFRGGFAADQGRALGTSSFTMNMLDEGAGELGALEFASAAEALGAHIGSSASLDGANVYLSALRDKLEPSLALFGDVIRRPRFDDHEIERVRRQWIAQIAQEKSRPNTLGFRLLPPLLYGDGHAYAIPFTGSGTAESIGALTRDEMLAWHRDFVRPDNATLIVVGNTTLEEILPLLNRQFGSWQAPASPLPGIAVATVERPAQARVFLVDQPGAIQANILVGQVIGSTMDDDALAFDIANGVFGGIFTARINMNLREDKGWSYGAYSFASGARGQRPWMIAAPVQIDRTIDAIGELQRELAEFVGGARPASEDEIGKIKASNVRGMPGQYETAGAVRGTISGILRYERPDDYVQQLKQRTEALPTAEIHAAAASLEPARMTWVIVGDLSQIEQPIRELGLGEVSVVDSDGQPLR
jgi:zinc protease